MYLKDTTEFVIPAKAGIYDRIPVFAGMTGFPAFF